MRKSTAPVLSPYSCQPLEHTAKSPGAKSGCLDSTTCATVRPGMISPGPTFSAYRWRPEITPRKYGSSERYSVRERNSPSPGRSTGASPSSKSVVFGAPSGMRHSRTHRWLEGTLKVAPVLLPRRRTTQAAAFFDVQLGNHAIIHDNSRSAGRACPCRSPRRRAPGPARGRNRRCRRPAS